MMAHGFTEMSVLAQPAMGEVKLAGRRICASKSSHINIYATLLGTWHSFCFRRAALVPLCRWAKRFQAGLMLQIGLRLGL